MKRTDTPNSPLINNLVEQSIDFHCHRVGPFDFTKILKLNLDEIEAILAKRNQKSILTLYLPKPQFNDFVKLMETFHQGRKAGKFKHIVGFSLEGPLLTSFLYFFDESKPDAISQNKNNQSNSDKYFYEELARFIENSPLTKEEIVARVSGGEDLQLLDLGVVKQNFLELKKSFSFADIHVAVKANSAPGVMEVLTAAGASFEVATIEEALFCVDKGVNAQDIIFSHPAKDAVEIAKAAQIGIKTFVSDSEEDIRLIGKHAQGSNVIIRIVAAQEDTDNYFKSDEDSKLRGFNSRFGVNEDDALSLLKYAKHLNLVPYGLTFHVGTQMDDPINWQVPIALAARIFSTASKEGIELEVLDLGGGFPSIHREKIPKLEIFSKEIFSFISESFPQKKPKIIIEPGRSVSAMAGFTFGRVMNIKNCNGDSKIVTISTGKFSAGLFGVGHSIGFFSAKDMKLEPMRLQDGWPVNFYGKACASFDIPIEGDHLRIPRSLQSGDVIVFSGTGAYTTTMQTNWCKKSNPSLIVFDSQQTTAANDFNLHHQEP